MDLRAAFAALADRLRDDRPDWSPRPLLGERGRWEDEEPELLRWLDAQDEAWLDVHEAAPHRAPGAPDALVRRGAALDTLAALPALPRATLATVPGLELGIPGRKWAQVRAFGEAVRADAPIVDWCGGKGHLGRTLGRVSGQPVLVVERDAALCAEAERLAARGPGFEARAPVQLRALCADVLREPPPLPAGSLVVALHACGALGDAAAEAARQGGAARLCLAPCCPHRLDGGPGWPRSAAARAQGWAPTRAELRLVSTDEVVAGAGPRRRRRAELEARAGGAAEARRVRARAALRAVYRRPLEVWAALDRALALEEGGAAVALGTFCPSAVTPRNLLLVAELRAPGPRTRRAWAC